MEIMQENGETVCCVASSLRNDAIPSIAKADISMSVHGQHVLGGCRTGILSRWQKCLCHMVQIFYVLQVACHIFTDINMAVKRMSGDDPRCRA